MLKNFDIFPQLSIPMVDVAQRLEHWTVTPGVGGSNPLVHPIFLLKIQQVAFFNSQPKPFHQLSIGRQVSSILPLIQNGLTRPLSSSRPLKQVPMAMGSEK